MKIDGIAYRSIWLNQDGWSVDIIDQTFLPHEFRICTLRSVEDAAEAILNMRVRGAPLIGATAAYGVALALRDQADDLSLNTACETLLSTRPTAVNLRWALDRLKEGLAGTALSERGPLAYQMADSICDEDVETNNAIGDHGLAVIRRLWEEKNNAASAMHVLTHCNAGWLATVDWARRWRRFTRRTTRVFRYMSG